MCNKETDKKEWVKNLHLLPTQRKKTAFKTLVHRITAVHFQRLNMVNHKLKSLREIIKIKRIFKQNNYNKTLVFFNFSLIFNSNIFIRIYNNQIYN